MGSDKARNPSKIVDNWVEVVLTINQLIIIFLIL
ncbi:hypothetical protein cce_3555 [Crocosphaera subtropica ATCC 51142]|uniref:Uncharacterized protein n=1 Tax=Crocosphaera subtropica (strain ATCC 51142 / BH68) TaxID=43989 RepID=B1X004_CROS5|nr:hypothetical protein cce_3555 [Crocosphaera subtropica ATCC 51142]